MKRFAFSAFMCVALVASAAPITDPAAVRFSNEKIRPAADVLASAYNTCVVLLNQWYAQNMSALILNTSSVIEDGAAKDGRQPLTGIDATNVVVRCQELVTDYDAGGGAKRGTVLKVAVNGGGRF